MRRPRVPGARGVRAGAVAWPPEPPGDLRHRHPRHTLAPRHGPDRPDPPRDDRDPRRHPARDDLLGHPGEAGAGRGWTRSTT